jgi:hypothetical protein
MYTRFLESLFESQTYPNENEHDPLGPDVSIFIIGIYILNSEMNVFLGS